MYTSKMLSLTTYLAMQPATTAETSGELSFKPHFSSSETDGGIRDQFFFRTRNFRIDTVEVTGCKSRLNVVRFPTFKCLS